MHTSPGVYALLVGSGVSSAAGIPTGWAITVDLVERVAVMEGADMGGDPEQWHRDRFGAEPDYSALLDQLGGTPAERQAIIKPYIEPSDDDRAKGLKVPTEAHRAIATLAARSTVRIIITTNFDRLIETALTDAGVDFDVIATVDMLKGARPVGTAQCVVIKLHGDYLDSRILNTADELAGYPPEFDVLLDRVLDEHGLIVCGWSAAWDPALRAAIARQPNRRYSTWWSTRGPLTADADRLLRSRGGTEIAGLDADECFGRLAGHLAALDEIDRPHPLTVAAAVAELKMYLPDPTKRIRLRDLVIGEANRVHEATSDAHLPVAGSSDADTLRDRTARQEAETATLEALFVTGCAWADDPAPFADALERIANSADPYGGNSYLLNLRRYPAVRCLYAGGIGALHTGRWGTLKALFYDRTFNDARGSNRAPLAIALSPWEVFGVQEARWLPGQDRSYTPAAVHLFTTLRPVLRDLIPDDGRYVDTFDRFEYLHGLVVQDLDKQGHRTSFRAPVGCFGWRHKYWSPDDGGHPVGGELSKIIDGDTVTTEPLAAGMFGGDLGRYRKAADSYGEIVERVGQSWF